MLQKLTSKLDSSINYINEATPGKLEARYVYRQGHPYFIAYLSSQTGCRQACRMCHLTATGQTDLRDATIDEMVRQAQTVLQGNTLPKADYVHFNFMARGEPLNNRYLLDNNQELFRRLQSEAASRGLGAKFLISTIMPKDLLPRKLTEVFQGECHPHMYYSLYSMKDSFRKRWLPKAMHPHLALMLLKEWSLTTQMKPKIHYAFIRGENDSTEDVIHVCNALQHYELQLDVNIVRYNPFSSKQGEESPEDVIQANAQIMREMLGTNVKVIPKVGYDVKASCGMFVK